MSTDHLSPAPGPNPDTARVKSFAKCAGCALILVCHPDAAGSPEAAASANAAKTGVPLVVLTSAGKPIERCVTFRPAGEQAAPVQAVG